MSRCFQFSLRALLVGTAIVAASVRASVHWWTLRHRAIVARQHFEDVQAKGASLDELRKASDDLLQAELKLPFTNERAAWHSQWERLRFIEMRVFAHSGARIRGWRELMRQRERTRLAAEKERKAIGRRLGLPSYD